LIEILIQGNFQGILPRPHKGKYISIASARQPVSDFPGSIRINLVKGKEHMRTGEGIAAFLERRKPEFL